MRKLSSVYCVVQREASPRRQRRSTAGVPRPARRCPSMPPRRGATTQLSLVHTASRQSTVNHGGVQSSRNTAEKRRANCKHDVLSVHRFRSRNPQSRAFVSVVLCQNSESKRVRMNFLHKYVNKCHVVQCRRALIRSCKEIVGCRRTVRTAKRVLFGYL